MKNATMKMNGMPVLVTAASVVTNAEGEITSQSLSGMTMVASNSKFSPEVEKGEIKSMKLPLAKIKLDKIPDSFFGDNMLPRIIFVPTANVSAGGSQKGAVLNIIAKYDDCFDCGLVLPPPPK